jgi:hypothetical protein
MRFELVPVGLLPILLRLRCDGDLWRMTGTREQWSALLLAIQSGDYTPQVYSGVSLSRAPKRGWRDRALTAGGDLVYLDEREADGLVANLLPQVDPEVARRLNIAS